MRFRDRTHVGQLLAAKLWRYANAPDVMVCALPRGGVVVGYEVAEALNAPLDSLIVRKLGVPGQEELAMGAIASGGFRVLRQELIEALGISADEVAAVIDRETRELERREILYRRNTPPLRVRGRTVILVDNGIATGATTAAAAAAIRQQQPKWLVIAIPVAPLSACMELAAQADEVVCVIRPEEFFAIGEYYEDFHQVSDEEVIELLGLAAKRVATHRISVTA
jgi:putative phosphoribosyl transferase